MPDRLPPHPETELIMKPELGVTVTVAVLPLATICVAGLTLPFAPAVAVTVKLTGVAVVNVAATVQLAVTGAVV